MAFRQFNDGRETLRFVIQEDGRRVAFMPGSGKVVLVDLKMRDKVGHGETWEVELMDHGNFYSAKPVLRVKVDPPTLRGESSSTLEARLGSSAKDILETVAKAPAATPAPVVKVEPQATPRVEPKRLDVQDAKRAAPNVPPGIPSAHERRSMPGLQHVAGELIEPLNVVQNDERVAIFVDAANTERAVRDAGFALDFKALHNLLMQSGTFYSAFYYTADFTQVDAAQAKFLDYLADTNYVVRKKPIKEIRDRGTGRVFYKSDVDVEMTIDLLNTMENWDVAFLVTGDSDFERCVDVLRSRGKRVYVVTTRDHISRELRQIADKPIFYLEEYMAQLAWRPADPSQAAAGSPA